MDRGAWQADTVHGVARVGHDLATKPPTPLCQLSPKHLIPSQSSSLLGESGPTRWPQEPSLFSPPPCFVLLQPVPYTGSPAPSRCYLQTAPSPAAFPPPRWDSSGLEDQPRPAKGPSKPGPGKVLGVLQTPPKTLANDPEKNNVLQSR